LIVSAYAAYFNPEMQMDQEKIRLLYGLDRSDQVDYNRLRKRLRKLDRLMGIF
jgi:hypothetical protein